MILRACVCAVIACVAMAAVAAMSPEEYKAQKARIEADYKAAMSSCRSLKGNERNVCRVEASGSRKVGLARLETQYHPSTRNDEKLRAERADAAYRLAIERCDARPGEERDACRNDAKAAFVNAKS